MAVKNKKVAAGVGIAAAAAAVLALGAGTFASFSATTNGPDATVAAGTLQFGGTANSNFTVGPLAPGDVSPATVLSFTNGGTTDGHLSLSLRGIVDTEDGCRGDELVHDNTCNDTATPGELSSKLEVTVRDAGSNTVYSGPVAGLTTTDVDIAAGATTTLSVSFQFLEGGPGDNAAQGDTAVISTTARLDQA